MGTRALIRINFDGTSWNLYKHYDGYIEGLGKEIAQFLEPMEIVNGISGGTEFGKVANGAGDGVLQLICHLKSLEGNQVGNLYAESSTATLEDSWCEYEYVINFKSNYNLMPEEPPITISCRSVYKDAFDPYGSYIEPLAPGEFLTTIKELEKIKLNKKRI